MTLSGLLAWIVAKLAALPVWKKVLLSLGVTLVGVELAFRALAPRSKAYAAWKNGIEAVGSVWTAVLLSIIYSLSVGPISFVMKLVGKDPLDRKLGSDPSNWHAHDPNPLGPRAAARHQF